MTQAIAHADEAHGHHDVTPDPQFGTASGGKVGMWLFLLTDAMSFSGLLIAYAVLRAGNHNGSGPHGQWIEPSAWLNIPATAVATFDLILSSVFMVLAFSAAQEKNQKALVGWLLATIACGVAFLGFQAHEYYDLIERGYTLSRGNEMATFFSVTGFHGGHVFSGVTYLSCVLVGAIQGKYTRPDGNANVVEIVGLFWHFVDLVWILVFTFVYLL